MFINVQWVIKGLVKIKYNLNIALLVVIFICHCILHISSTCVCAERIMIIMLFDQNNYNDNKSRFKAI